MTRSLRVAALVVLAACGTATRNGDPPEAENAAGAGRGVMLEPLLCPDGNEPADDLARECPKVLPEAGSCCGKAGLACPYPGDDTYHRLALCIDDQRHAPFWQQTVAFDRLECSLDGTLSALGEGAEPCETRVVEPCEPEGVTTPQELLNMQFAAIIEACGPLPNESRLEATFVDGCATELSDSLSGPPNSHVELLDCVREALDVHHFDCAEQLDCARIERSTLK